MFLKSLPVGVKFNICSFGSTHSFLWPKSKSYSRDSLNEALAHVGIFEADLGGTKTYAALRATIGNRYLDIPCEVMLLTDGDIWNQDELFKYLNQEVDKSNSNLRVFALGIGNGVSHALIEGVARAGNGFGQIVNNDEKLDSKVIRMLKGGLTPHTTDYSLEVEYGDPADEFEMIERVTDSLEVMLSEKSTPKIADEKQQKQPISFFDQATQQSGQEKPPSAGNDDTDPYAHLPDITAPRIIQTPQKIPTLFPFSRTSVYLLFSGESSQRTPKNVILRAKSDHGPLELKIGVEILSQPHQTIHQLAARKAIQEMEEGRGWIFEAKDQNGTLIKDTQPSRFDDMVQREAVRLGVKFQVGGKWCSFVAVRGNPSESKDSAPKAYTPETSVYGDGAETDTVKECGEDDSGEDEGFSCFDDGTGSIIEPSSYASMQAAPYAMVSRTQAHIAPTSAAFRYSTVSSGYGGAYGSGGAAPYLRELRGGGDGGATASHRFRSTKSRRLNDSGRSSATQTEDRIEATGSKCSPDSMTDSEKVHAVIGLQDFEGSWEYSKELYQITGLKKPRRKQVLSKAWVTWAVVLWLEGKMGKEQEVWELVVQKARMWLEGEGEGAKVESKVRQAYEL